MLAVPHIRLRRYTFCNEEDALPPLLRPRAFSHPSVLYSDTEDVSQACHVTNLLASQTLSLLLAVPQSMQQRSTSLNVNLRKRSVDVVASRSSDHVLSSRAMESLTVKQRKRSSLLRPKGLTSQGSLDSTNNSEKSFDSSEQRFPQPDYDLDSLGISSNRQKKFLRLFHEVPPEERLLNFYSCALASDLLLQGHLYVTKNHFAFYSKVFGYVTKLLIPVSEVRRISKEKTVKLFPNAVGITTHSEKHVLTSLLSRDATYRLLTNVWRVYHYPNGLLPLTPNDVDREMDGSSINDEQSSNDSFSQGLFRNGRHQHRSEGSRSDDEDSAIERSQTPSPARQDEESAEKSQLQLISSFSQNDKFSFECKDSNEGTDEVDSPTATTRNRLWMTYLIRVLMVISLITSALIYYRMYKLHDSLVTHLETSEELAMVHNNLLKVRQILDNLETATKENPR